MNGRDINFTSSPSLKREAQDEKDNDTLYRKKMKYYTSQEFPELNNTMNIHSGFGSFSQEVENGTKLQHSAITNPRVRPDWGPLQTNIGSVTSSGPVVSKGQRIRKSELVPDNEYYKRSFYQLKGDQNHTPISSRGGNDTRQDTREEYR